MNELQKKYHELRQSLWVKIDKDWKPNVNAEQLAAVSQQLIADYAVFAAMPPEGTGPVWYHETGGPHCECRLCTQLVMQSCATSIHFAGKMLGVRYSLLFGYRCRDNPYQRFTQGVVTMKFTRGCECTPREHKMLAIVLKDYGDPEPEGVITVIKQLEQGLDNWHQITVPWHSFEPMAWGEAPEKHLGL